MFRSWIALGVNAAGLGWEAQNVIALRLMRLAAGRIGPTEAGLMITEKIAAATDAVATTFVLEGGNGHTAAKKIINVYKKRVRANKRRLSK
jgi:hypothetical protein